MIPEPPGYKTKTFEPRNLLLFFLVVFGLRALADGLLISGIVKVSGEGLAAFSAGSGVILVTLGAWGPIIAAFVVTAVTEGKAGERVLWGRFWNLNMRLKWLLVALLIVPVLQLAANLLSRTLDGQVYPWLALPNPAWAVIPAFITAFIFSGMAEEFGWRGYVLPRFQAKWSALISSLLLGGVWALWHVGEWFYRGSNLYQRNFWEWAVGMILLSIVMTWVFNNTKGSILPAALIHAMWNTGIIWHRPDWHFYEVLLLTAILIVVIFGPKDLMRHRAKTIP